MSFLNAEWRKLALANYAIDPSILQEYLPFGTELDTFKGKCYVSLVGFMFLNTKVLGLKVPFHVNFEEVNLRFYVKRIEGKEVKRGVVFVKEIVPKAAITFVANTFYKENYETMKMEHHWESNSKELKVAYRWRRNEVWQEFEVHSEPDSIPLEEGSEAEFITEHYWGYAHVNDSKSVEYEVTHPKWDVYPVQDYKIDVDFGTIYHPKFEFLNKQNPDSVFLAEGSEITVKNKRMIT